MVRNSCPRARSASQASRNWVDLPEPSVPSNTISFPDMGNTSKSSSAYFPRSRAPAADTRNSGSFAIRPMRDGWTHRR